MDKQSDIYFLKLLQDSINTLNELDNLIASNGDRQSKVDSELCDLLHMIENNDLSDFACVKVVKRIKELRKIRRSLRNEYELILKYQELKTRLSSKENRQFIVAEISKRMKDLNQPYKNRIITDEQVQDFLENKMIVGVTTSIKPRKRSEKNDDINAKIQKMLEQGYSQKRIAVELKMSQPSVSLRIKKMKELQEV